MSYSLSDCIVLNQRQQLLENQKLAFFNSRNKKFRGTKSNPKKYVWIFKGHANENPSASQAYQTVVSGLRGTSLVHRMDARVRF
jgi:hypothetical protein